MSAPVYCILSAGTVHCVPVTTFSTDPQPAKLLRSPLVNSQLETPCNPVSPQLLKIKHRNLLYTLNNPLLSDLESDTSRRLSQGSVTADDERLGDLGPLTPPRASVLNSHLRLTEKWAQKVDAAPVLDVDTAVHNGTLDLHIAPADDEEALGDVDLTAILNDYSAHAVYLPQYAVDLRTNLDLDYTQIKTLLSKIFPAWTGDVAVTQLTGGITNMLLACTHAGETLLMRVYGQGTNLIIDRNREFVSHLVLNSLRLAPPIHARFSNGLIYGFLPGRSLEPRELSNAAVYPLIAQQLGKWHNSINCEYIEDGVEKLRKHTAGAKKPALLHVPRKPKKKLALITNVWELIEDWILIVPANDALVDIFKANLDTPVSTDNVRDVVLAEFRWLKSTLLRATKSSVVVAHCDLLSGNIIIPKSDDFSALLAAGKPALLPPLQDNPIQFIDYEYMLPAPRAFDIANHFAEWQGFDCDRLAIPDPSPHNPVMVAWVKGYLSDENASQAEVEALIKEIACYYGMPGFYWGIWAMIQSELSTIDFNYAEYSALRLEEYWIWKKSFQRSH